MRRTYSHRGVTIDTAQFERLVAEAMDRLPRRYQRLIRNVVVLIEDEPDQELLDALQIHTDAELLGVYTGIPIGLESFFDMGGRLPPRIIIFRGPILRRSSSYDEAREEILKTVMHEIGHHFGLKDSDMPC